MTVRPDSQLGFRQTMDGQTDRQKETDITKQRVRTCHVVTYMRESSSYEVYETILSDTVSFIILFLIVRAKSCVRRATHVYKSRALPQLPLTAFLVDT